MSIRWVHPQVLCVLEHSRAPLHSSPPEGSSSISAFSNVVQICWQMVQMRRQSLTGKAVFVVLFWCCAVCGVQAARPHLSGCQGEFLLVKNDSKRPPCVSSNVLNFKE